MDRYGSVIRLRSDKVEEYIALHRNVWDGVQDVIRQCNIKNYSIFYKGGWLFSYFEYHGTDFKRDMAKMASDRLTQEWWALCEPCQEPLAGRSPGEWWASMSEIYHQD